MVSPASIRPSPSTSLAALATLSRRRPEVRLVGVLVLSAFEPTATSSGPRALAVAVLSALPASTWAWLMLTAPVQVSESPGNRSPSGQSTAVDGSSTATACRVWTPVLVSTKL